MDTLVIGKRGTLDELYHTGSICVVDEEGKIIYSLGDYQQQIFLRSTSKVFQIIPLLYHNLDLKYNLNLQDIAIMVSSHIGSQEQLRVIDSIMKKTQINEEDFCIKPTYPISFASTKLLIEQQKQPSPKYHMCSGKHIGLMLAERAFNKDYQTYFHEDSYATTLSKEVIAQMANIAINDVIVGLDGCGVPVFGLSLYQAAVAFQHFSNPQFDDDKLNKAILKVQEAVSTYPDLVRGQDYFCSYHNYDSNVIGKDGAHGYYAFGLKKEKLGIAFKLFSGDMSMLPYVTNHLYHKIGYSNERLLPHIDFTFKNDNNQTIGEYIAVF